MEPVTHSQWVVVLFYGTWQLEKRQDKTDNRIESMGWEIIKQIPIECHDELRNEIRATSGTEQAEQPPHSRIVCRVCSPIKMTKNR